MTRFLLVALLCALPSGAVHAQTTFGAITGLNRVSFAGSGATDVTSTSTFMIGVSGEIAVSETFALRPELYYSAKGAKISTLVGDPQFGPIKRFQLPYIQLPVLAQLRTASGRGALRPHLFGGLSVGVLISCSLQGQDCDDIEEVVDRRLDVGVLVGGELEWRGVGVGARYEAGVRAMEASVRGNEIHNGVISFTVRYLPGT